jgi:hypothetical protein
VERCVRRRGANRVGDVPVSVAHGYDVRSSTAAHDNAVADVHIHGDGDPIADRHPVAHSHGDAVCDDNPSSHAIADGDAYSHANTHDAAITHANTHDAAAHVHADCDADSNRHALAHVSAVTSASLTVQVPCMKERNYGD